MNSTFFKSKFNNIFYKDWVQILLIISLSISFWNDINVYPISKVITYGLMIVWICLAIIKLFLNIFDYDQYRDLLRRFFACNFLIKLFIYIYTICLIVFGVSQSRFFSTNMETFINAISAIAIVYLFGKNSLKCSVSAICLTFFSALVVTIGIYKLDFYKKLEFHDIAFSGGYILLYLFFASKRWILKNKIYILSISLMILLAFKRIGIAALIITILYYIIIEQFNEKTKRKLIYISGGIAICISYIYVYLVISGKFVNVIDIIGDFTSGRYYYYQIVQELCDFDIRYLGMGRNAMAVMFSQEYSYFHVGNLHSDILRMYAECGFVVFGLWLCNYFFLFPRCIENRFGFKAFELFFICTIYNFLIYFTDNTELYIANQYFYILIPAYYALKVKGAFRGKAKRRRW